MNKHVSLRPRRFYWCLYSAGFFGVLSFGNPVFLVAVIPLIGIAYKSNKDGSCDSNDLGLKNINQFSTDPYNQIQNAYERIASFDEVENWDSTAAAYISEIDNYHQLLNDHKSYLKSKIDEFRKEREAGKVHEKIFKYHTKERVVGEILNEFEKISFESLKSNLQSQIEFSPNNDEEKKDILEKLADLKDDLKNRKKDIMDGKRFVREKAKNKNEEISNSFFSSPQSRRLDRHANKQAKEQALAELERNKNQLIVQMEFADRQIAWVKKINGKKKAVGNFDISPAEKTKSKAS